MADPINYNIPQEEYQAFDAWRREKYPTRPSDQSVYRIWTYLGRPGYTPRPPQTTTTTQPAAPGGTAPAQPPSGSLPSTIRIGSMDVPVNWTLLGPYPANDEADVVAYAEALARGEEPTLPTQGAMVDVWMPVLPANMTIPSVVWNLQNYLFQTPEGQRDFTPVTPDDLNRWEVTTEGIAQAGTALSWQADITKNNPELLNAPGFDDYLSKQSENVASGKTVNFQDVSTDLQNLQANPDFIYNLRGQGKAAGDVRSPEYEQQFGQATSGLFGRLNETMNQQGETFGVPGSPQGTFQTPGPTEYERLQQVLGELKPLYDKYAGEEKAGRFTRGANLAPTSDQLISAVLNQYETYAQRLQDIQSGKQPAEGAVTGAAAAAAATGVPGQNVEAVAQAYADSISSGNLPQWVKDKYPNLTPEQINQTLVPLGQRVNENNAAVASAVASRKADVVREQERQWRTLVNRAKQVRQVATI